MDFSLTDEQKALQQLARDYVNRHVRPVAAEFDRNPNPIDCIPSDVVEEGSKLGLRTLALSDAHGGGADMLTLSIVGEELGAGDLGVAATFDQTWKFTPIIEHWTNDEQKERFLPAFVSDHRFHLATCITEPDAGTDHVLPYAAAGSGVQMRAERDGDIYRLSGVKRFISNGGTAKLYIVYTRTDKTQGGLKGMTPFLVPADTPGLSVGQIHDKMGRRLLSNATLIFENAEVPAINRLGEKENEAEALRTSRIARGRGGYGATVLGAGRAAFEEAVRYAQERIQGGKPIGQHQAVAQMIGEMYTRLEAARSVLWRTSWAVDYAEDYDPKMSWLTKVVCSEAAYEVCRLALEVHGGMGYMRECPVEKYLRDVISFLHGAGNNHIFRIKISSRITGLPAE